MTAPAYFSSAGASSAVFSTTHVVNTPTGSGGILILHGSAYNDQTVVVGDASPPSGSWTLQSFIANVTAHDGTIGPAASWVWTKPSEVGDGATFTWTTSAGLVGGTGGDYYDSLLVRYTHSWGAPVVNTVATPTQGRSTNSSVPALTTTVNDCVIVTNHTGYGTGITTPATGYTSQVVFDTSIVLLDRQAATAGTFGPSAHTHGNDTHNNHALALAPPAPPVGPYLQADGALYAIASGTTITPVIPAGDAADDIAIMGVMCNVGCTFTTPTNWTVLGTPVNSANQSTAWFWKRMTGSDGDPVTTASVTFSTTQGGYGRIWLFRQCVATGDPFEDVTMNGTPTLSTTPASATIDTTNVNRLAVCFVMVDDDNAWSSGNPPSGWVNCGTRVVSTTGADAMFDAISQEVATASTVTGVTIGTQAASDYWRTLTLALIPTSTGGSTGTAEWTEEEDTIAAAGVRTIIGDVAFTETDTIASAGVVTRLGALAWTEADDTIAMVGSAGTEKNADLAWTEADDTFAVVGIVTRVGTAVWTDVDDTVLVQAVTPIQGPLAFTDEDDTVALFATAIGTLFLQWTEDADTIAMAGVHVRNATLAWTEADDTISVAGAATVAATLAWTETDTISASGTVTRFGTLAFTDEDDTISIAASHGTEMLATLVWTEEDDLISMVGEHVRNATLSWTEDNDSVMVLANAASTADLAWTDEDDTILVQVTVSVQGVAGWTEVDDLLVLEAIHYRNAALFWQEDNDLMLIMGRPVYTDPRLLDRYIASVYQEPEVGAWIEHDTAETYVQGG